MDQPGCFELAQEITGADDTDAFIDDDTASLNVAALKQQQRFGGRIAAQEAVERFNGCLFAKPANGTPFFAAALLVDADIGRHDLHHVEMGIDPFDDLLGSRRAVNARRLEKNHVRDTHRQAGPQQHVQRSRKRQCEQR